MLCVAHCLTYCCYPVLALVPKSHDGIMDIPVFLKGCSKYCFHYFFFNEFELTSAFYSHIRNESMTFLRPRADKIIFLFRQTFRCFTTPTLLLSSIVGILPPFFFHIIAEGFGPHPIVVTDDVVKRRNV